MENEAQFNAVVEFLLEHETMSGAQFAACMEGQPIDEQSTTSLFDVIE